MFSGKLRSLHIFNLWEQGVFNFIIVKQVLFLLCGMKSPILNIHGCNSHSRTPEGGPGPMKSCTFSDSLKYGTSRASSWKYPLPSKWQTYCIIIWIVKLRSNFLIPYETNFSRLWTLSMCLEMNKWLSISKSRDSGVSEQNKETK